ncbi:plasmid mobilization protein [Algoriphagus sp. NG3]|uniref:plasmid mobilization protein n=1 Tax=Algoriphagus sp. NG3 TaxID=3097546 RepID=UPI002A812253|nr:plasmid mobilization relaxosome protein MobC [Algoriphagus sp. NG3]WPR77932.1 plasmid mobilization relaxosome protein MobC [Algoriphagus sp. NG3]
MKEENKRNKWLHIRLTDRELLKLKGNFEETVHDNLSEYSRRILLKKLVIGRYRDTGIQELLRELTALKRDLHGLATNYNQLAKKMNTATDDELNTNRFKVVKLEQSIQESLKQVNQFIDQTAEKWLQS